MSEFKKCHPMISFLYFIFVIVFSCFFLNPFLLFISLSIGMIHSFFANGLRALRFNLFYMLPAVILTALINPLFNHEGTIVLAYFPTGNPLTLEAVLYGVLSAAMLWSVICHFSVFNAVMTSDKFVYIFGKITPLLSLVLSMIIRFVPRFKAQLKEVINVQKSAGLINFDTSALNRIKNAVRIMLIMLTWSFENAIDTADSMKSRGYGSAKRTAYSNYTFSKRDIFFLIYMLIFAVTIVYLAIKGNYFFQVYPFIKMTEFSYLNIGAYAVYILFFIIPFIIELKEVIRWKKLKSKI